MPRDTLASLRGRIERLIEERGHSSQQFIELQRRYDRLYAALVELGKDPDKIVGRP